MEKEIFNIKQLFVKFGEALICGSNPIYHKLKDSYQDYRENVLSGNKTFDVFVHEALYKFSMVEFDALNTDVQILQIRRENSGKYYSIFKLRPDLIEKYFCKPDFHFLKAKDMVCEFDSTTKIFSESSNYPQKKVLEIEKNNTDKIVELSVEEAKKYLLRPNSTTHMAMRIGGYLFLSGYLTEKKLDNKILRWSELIQHSIGDAIYLSSPDTVKSSKKITLRHLEELFDFFTFIEASEIAKIIAYDIQKLKKQTHAI
jgi:hypothetical protein